MELSIYFRPVSGLAQGLFLQELFNEYNSSLNIMMEAESGFYFRMASETRTKEE